MSGGPADARFVVGADAVGQRLDAVVSTGLGVSRAAARRLVTGGQVRVDGRVRAKGVVVAAGAVVTVARGAHATTGAAQAIAPDDDPRAISVVHEDDALVAVDKPAGMPSHPLRPGERGTVANLIVARFPECAAASPDPREGGLGHRLDTATSGVLVAARDRAVWVGLRAALGAPDCEKRYLAEVWGAPPEEEGRVDAAIGRRGRRGTTVRLDGGRNPRPAQTTWRVIERRASTALVEARLHAGRPHQVRAHLAAAGFPIVGDDRYGDRSGGRSGNGGDAPAGNGGDAPGAMSGGGPSGVPAPSGLRLHAASVTFRHPTTGALVTVGAPPPAWARSRR